MPTQSPEDSIGIGEQYYQLSRVYFRLGRFDRALECIDKAIEVEPDSKMFAERAAIYMAKGDNAKSREDSAAARSSIDIKTDLGEFTLHKQ